MCPETDLTHVRLQNVLNWNSYLQEACLLVVRCGHFCLTTILPGLILTVSGGYQSQKTGLFPFNHYSGGDFDHGKRMRPVLFRWIQGRLAQGEVGRMFGFEATEFPGSDYRFCFCS